MTNEEMLIEMFKMQVALNKAICDEKNLTLYSIGIEKVRTALLDEVGELTHELKGNWCWWKKTQAPVDRNKVLEELVDCWHFALTLYEIYVGDEPIVLDEVFSKQMADVYGYIKIVSYILNALSNIIDLMVALTYYLDFTIDDVYNAYIKKNKVNYERLKNGY